jgi:hypothetical protein
LLTSAAARAEAPPPTAPAIEATPLAAKGAGVAPRVALFLPACAARPGLDAEFESALALELSSAGISVVDIETGFGAQDILLEVQQLCEPHASSALLRVVYRGTRRERQLSLGDVPESHRVRGVALAAAELVEGALEEPSASSEAAFSLDEEEPHSPPAAVAPAPSTASTAEAAAPRPVTLVPAPRRAASDDAGVAKVGRSRESSSSLGIGPEVRAFAGGAFLWGAYARFAVARFAFGARALHGGATSPLGEVSATLIHATAALRFHEWRLGEHSAFAWGPRLGLGVVSVTGTPAAFDITGFVERGPYVDAAVSAELGVTVARWLRLDGALELGLAYGLVAQAGGTPVAEYGGPFVGVSVGVAFEL